MKRKIEAQLIDWKGKHIRMPLILNGARQVGKTYILKHFGAKHFTNTIYINLEIQKQVALFFEDHVTPNRVIPFLETIYNQKISEKDTLIILDEIQSCPKALLSLKSFCEDAPQYFIVSAGSLLGVAINRDNISFPVGKVDELTLFPLDFEEFLWAMGLESLSIEIKKHFLSNEPIAKSYHLLALEKLNSFLVVGGMPACVYRFIVSNNYMDAAEVQINILNEYAADMSKYASNSQAVKIRACYDSIPIQISKENKKFQYKIVQRGGTATIFGESIDWLIYAGITHKCEKISHGYIPIQVFRDLSDFKLYLGDVGLLVNKSGYPIQNIISGFDENNTFKGAIIENYVAQALVANKYQLLYWKNENTAELDFIIQQENNVIPIEVKSGNRTKSTSFNNFIKKYNINQGIRLSTKNFGIENQIKSVPLYATWCI